MHFSSSQGATRGHDDKEIRRRPVARVRAEPFFGRLRSRPPRIVRHDSDHALRVLFVLPRGGDVLGVGVVEVDVDLLLRDERGLHRVPDHERVVALDEGRVRLGVAGKDRVVLVVAIRVCGGKQAVRSPELPSRLRGPTSDSQPSACGSCHCLSSRCLVSVVQPKSSLLTRWKRRAAARSLVRFRVRGAVTASSRSSTS